MRNCCFQVNDQEQRVSDFYVVKEQNLIQIICVVEWDSRGELDHSFEKWYGVIHAVDIGQRPDY